jgi:hypothetical protein
VLVGIVVATLVVATAPSRAAEPTVDCEQTTVLPNSPTPRLSDTVLAGDGETVLFRQVRGSSSATSRFGHLEVGGGVEWVEDPATGRILDVSEDGTRVLLTDPLRILDLDDDTTTPLANIPSGNVADADLDHGVIVFLDPVRNIVRYDVASGTTTTLDEDEHVWRVDLSADASRMLIVYGSAVWSSTRPAHSRVLDAATGELVAEVHDAVGGGELVWSQFLPPLLYGTGTRASLTADGTAVVSATTDALGGANADGNQELVRQAIPGGPVEPLTDTTGTRHDRPLASTDGSQIVFSTSAPSSIRAMDLETLEWEDRWTGPTSASDVQLFSLDTTGDVLLARLLDRPSVVVLHEDGTTVDVGVHDARVSASVSSDGPWAFASAADVDSNNPGLDLLGWSGGPQPTPVEPAAPPGLFLDPAAAPGGEIAHRTTGDETGDNADGSLEVVLRAADGTPTAVTEIPGPTAGWVGAPAISSDGSTVAFLGSEGLGTAGGSQDVGLWAWTASDGLEAAPVHDLGSTGSIVGVSADGRWVGLLSSADPVGQNPGGTRQLFRWDRVDGTVAQVTTGATHPTLGMLANDGTMAWVTWGASGAQDQHVHRAPTEGPTTVTAAHGAVAAITSDGGHAIVRENPAGPVDVVRRLDLQSGSRPAIELDPQAIDDQGSLEVDATGRLLLDVDRSIGQDAVTEHRCAAFTDVPLDHTFATEVEWAVDLGITTGYTDQTFKPSATVTRQAMAAFIYRLAGADEPAPTAAVFDDVSAAHPFATEIAWAADEGITTGYQDGTFRPGAVVSRQAAVAFLHRLVDPSFAAPGAATFDDVSPDHPFFLEVEWAADEGITTGYGDDTFMPAATVTRQATAAFLHRTAPLL